MLLIDKGYIMSISKELLSAVLGYKVEAIVDSPSRGGIHCIRLNHRHTTINIHELAHKCKEWARKEYDIVIGYGKHIDIMLFSKGASILTDTALYGHRGSDSEPEAVFKACQWVLDNKDK